jgi:phosphonate transport system permease protein
MQEQLTHVAQAKLRSTPKRPSLINQRILWGFFFLCAVLWALSQTGIFQQQVINPGGWTVAQRFLRAAVHPDLSPSFLQLTFKAVITTLAFAIAGTFFSLIWGFIAGILASETWWRSQLSGRSYQAPWMTVRAVLAVLRSVHEVIWGLIFISVIGLDPLSAILAISIPFGAIIGKVFAEILDESPQEAYQALLSSGASPSKAFAYALIPGALPDLVSYSFYRFECAIRAAAVLGIIGAGGLGYEIMLSLQTLNYAQIWTLLLALFILNGLADFWSALVRKRISPSTTCCYSSLDREVLQTAGSQQVSRNTLRKDRVVLTSLAVGVLLVPLAFLYVRPDFSRLLSQSSLDNFVYIAESAFPPDFSSMEPSQWAQLAGVTLAMSILAVAGAGVVSLPMSFAAANNFLLPGGLLDIGRSGVLQQTFSVALLLASRLLLLVFRSVPAPIWALILLYIFFPGILPGAIALGLYTLGVLGRLNAERIENLDERPLRALKSQGAGGGQVFTYGVLPPTIPGFLGYTFYRWEEAIRATIVVGLVGAGGLGRTLTEHLSSFNYQAVFTSLIVFVGIIFLVDLTSSRARKAFR